MATNIYMGQTDARQQICTVTPSAVDVGDTAIIRITDDDGDTVDISFVAASAVVADIVDGLLAAWNASGHPLAALATPTDSTTHLTLTAKTAGAPFVISDQSIGMTLTIATTTTNRGSSDWGVPENWSLARIPISTDDIIIPPGAPSIEYGLNQSAVTAASLETWEGFASSIGRYVNGKMHYLRIAISGTLKIRGSGALIAINIGSSAISPYVDHSATSSSDGMHVVYISGSAIAGGEIRAGIVAFDSTPSGTTTLAGDYKINGENTTLFIGAGVTLSSNPTFKVQEGAKVTCHASGGVVTLVGEDSQWTQETGTWTTITVFNGAEANPNGTGTYATTNLYRGGTVFSRTQVAKTFTALNKYDGGDFDVPGATITTFTGYGGASVAEGASD